MRQAIWISFTVYMLQNRHKMITLQVGHNCFHTRNIPSNWWASLASKEAPWSWGYTVQRSMNSAFFTAASFKMQLKYRIHRSLTMTYWNLWHWLLMAHIFCATSRIMKSPSILSNGIVQAYATVTDSVSHPFFAHGSKGGRSHKSV